jgi:hypothetical protein
MSKTIKAMKQAASYLDKESPEQSEQPAYVIGAVFNKQTKKYGFHS